MKTNNTTSANLKGMAKHTYNRVMSAMTEDSDPAMLHTFAALTEGAKAIALQSGNFSNLYIRGINKGMTAEEAANELTERAAALVSRKLRKIDMICAASFLAEYITRQRKEAEQPEPTNPDNTPATMNANEVKTMQDIENQAYRLGERNWRRRNVWESSEASKTAKNSRDKLINKAYLNAAAKHLTEKARAINSYLTVRPMHEAFCVALEYISPAVGMSLKIASPFCVEAFLNNPEQVLEKLNA